MEKNHRVINKLIYDYFAGEALSEKDKRIISDHISVCDECLETIHDMVKIKGILKTQPQKYYMEQFLERAEKLMNEGIKQEIAKLLLDSALEIDPENRKAKLLLGKLREPKQHLFQDLKLFLNKKLLELDKDYLFVEDHLEIPVATSATGELQIKDKSNRILFELSLSKSLLFDRKVPTVVFGKAFENVDKRNIRKAGEFQGIEVMVIPGQFAAKIVIK